MLDAFAKVFQNAQTGKSGFVVAISDYPVIDMASGEVQLELMAALPEGWGHFYQSSPGKDTVSTGFIAAQLANNRGMIRRFGGERYLLYVNCAPRMDNTKGRMRNQGEGLVLAELTTGVRVFAVNAGYNLSFLKPQIQRLRVVDCPDYGSQFRSRDVFPGVVGEFAHCLVGAAEYEKFRGDLDVDAIPDIPAFMVAYIDSFGNVKLSTRKSGLEFENGTEVVISKFGYTEHPIKAVVTETSFELSTGNPALSSGSSGYGDPFVEIFVRGGSAAELLNLQVGDIVQVSAIQQVGDTRTGRSCNLVTEST
jgi:hypothetical protein